MLGLGVMLKTLGGNADSADAFGAALGKTIAAVTLDSDKGLRIAFSDGTAILLSDDGQSCCESRYMTCDDDLASFVGAKLMGGEVAEGPTTDNDGACHETAFLRVHTDRGDLVCCTHNEHNGYYGGFSVRCHAVRP